MTWTRKGTPCQPAGLKHLNERRSLRGAYSLEMSHAWSGRKTISPVKRPGRSSEAKMWHTTATTYLDVSLVALVEAACFFAGW
jgi:hypothetical protein